MLLYSLADSPWIYSGHLKTMVHLLLTTKFRGSIRTSIQQTSAFHDIWLDYVKICELKKIEDVHPLKNVRDENFKKN